MSVSHNNDHIVLACYRRDCINYHGFSLLSIIGKLVAQVKHKRLQKDWRKCLPIIPTLLAGKAFNSRYDPLLRQLSEKFDWLIRHSTHSRTRLCSCRDTFFFCILFSRLLCNAFYNLGSTVSVNAFPDKEINIRMGKAVTTFGRLSKHAWNYSKLTTNTKITKIEVSWQNKITNEKVLKTSNILSIYSLVKQRRLRL